MKINEEAVDYVFVKTSYQKENVTEVLIKLELERNYNKKKDYNLTISRDTILQYVAERKKFIKKYGIKISRDKIKENQIENEIKKGIKSITAKNNQTSISW